MSEPPGPHHEPLAEMAVNVTEQGGDYVISAPIPDPLPLLALTAVVAAIFVAGYRRWFDDR